ncbi:pilus (MSHA type) biogenesis protein MshL [Chitinimonas sp. BJYL2]|uniref:pilus (MSHA type) biogenesis protein MshL n=1 Tax=Chitinimonas sp. BJYL2 TaxID=2976696 RepID=UPI0022B4D06E|nr:pilus (MSHA type) biogenesis protein MshL [Chitinimonas sp. BJYL2]
MRRPLILSALMFAAGCATQPVQVDPQRHVTPPAERPADLPQPVERHAFLPKPGAQTKTDTYSVVVNNVPVRDLMFALARDAKLNVDVHPLVKGTVTLNALNQTLPQILDRIARQIDMRYTLENGVLAVVPDRPFLKTYTLDYVNITRSTKSTVTISTSVSSAGGSVSGTGGSTGNAGSNSSVTEVSNTSDNKFWERLETNIRSLLQSTRAVTQQEKQEREAMEAKDEQSRNAEVAEQKAEAERRKQEERMRAAQMVAQAGTGAPQLLSMVLGPNAQQANPQAADAKSDDVFIHPETGVLSVNATSREHAKVQEFLDRITASARRQVLIEATIVEVSLNDQYQTGINWASFKANTDGSLQDNRANITQNALGDSLSQLPYTLLTYTKKASSLLNGADFTATVKALEQFGKAKVLSSPKIMALNNQTALLKVVDEKVYFNITLDIEAATQNSPERRTWTSEIHTVPVGMVMSVTPQVSDGDTVSLNVRPTISRITGYQADPALALAQSQFGANDQKVQNLIPEIQVREVESTLRLASGQVAILGGLIQDQVDNKRSGIPGLSRLPFGAGDLFSYRDDVATKTELVIFLRPVVIRDASLNGDLSEYRQYLPAEDFFNRKQDEISVFKSGLPAR